MPHIQVMPGLPKPIERALRNAVFEYSKARRQFLERFAGQYDYEFSVTDLMQAPKQLWLRRKFRDDIVIDLVRDNYFSLLGAVVHHILEKYAPPQCIVEERQHTFMNVDGKRILLHGQPDLYDPDTEGMDDYKFVSAYAVLYEKAEYEFQLNVGKYLFETRGIPVKGLRNIYLFRHLDPIAQLRNPDYPKDNIYIKVHQPWSRSVTEEKIKQLVSGLIQYAHTTWSQLPDCTDDQRWIRESTFAVIKRKKGTKANPIGDWSSRAFAKFDTEQEALSFMKESSEKEEMKLEKRIGDPKKCLKYCPVVQWCEQRQKELRMNPQVLVD